jgi:hypothetical protein
VFPDWVVDGSKHLATPPHVIGIKTLLTWRNLGISPFY